MAERKQFFISIDKEDVHETSVPDGIEYEVIATQDEINEIRNLFEQKDKDTKNAVKFLAKPFNESGADKERKKYDDHLMTIFQRIYDLGTKKTKEEIKEQGIIK